MQHPLVSSPKPPRVFFFAASMVSLIRSGWTALRWGSRSSRGAKRRCWAWRRSPWTDSRPPGPPRRRTTTTVRNPPRRERLFVSLREVGLVCKSVWKELFISLFLHKMLHWCICGILGAQRKKAKTKKQWWRPWVDHASSRLTPQILLYIFLFLHCPWPLLSLTRTLRIPVLPLGSEGTPHRVALQPLNPLLSLFKDSRYLNASCLRLELLNQTAEQVCLE